MLFSHMRSVGNVGQEVLWGLLNPHLLSLVTLPPRMRVYEVKARELMRYSRRFDIPLKYQCVRHWQEYGESAWISELYMQHISAFTNGSFVEGDGRKCSAEDYLRQFRELIRSVQQHGFDPSHSLIPVNEEGECIDGSHRLAVAAYYDQTVRVVKLPLVIHRYDHRFFAERGFEPRFGDYVALGHCLADPSARIVNLHPLARGRDGEVEDILEEYGRIFFKKVLKARGRLPQRIVRLYYAQESWIGDAADGYAGANWHAHEAFRGRLFSPVRVYVVSGADDAGLREAKARIRALYGKGNYPVHINDDHQSTCELARVWFNDNSIEHLSHARERVFPRFERYRAALGGLMAESQVDRESYCVDGSAVLSAWGIRDCQDMDYLAAGGAALLQAPPDVACHNSEAGHYAYDIDELVLVPEHHFYHDGIKYLTLERVLEMKRARGEIPKDVRDIRQIRLFRLMAASGVHSALLLDGLAGLGRLSDASCHLLHRLYRRVARLFEFQVHRDMLGWLMRAQTLCLHYRGDRIYYRRGDANIARLKRSGRFRSELLAMLAGAGRDHGISNVLDVGVISGLSTVSLARALPQSRIFAMLLPGDDHGLLQRSLQESGLEAAVQLVYHGRQEGQGGGIDAGWLDAGSPRIDLLNIAEDYRLDTIVQGARHLLAACAPVITVNLRQRGDGSTYGHMQLEAALRPLGYRLTDHVGSLLDGQPDAAMTLLVYRPVATGDTAKAGAVQGMHANA